MPRCGRRRIVPDAVRAAVEAHQLPAQVIAGVAEGVQQQAVEGVVGGEPVAAWSLMCDQPVTIEVADATGRRTNLVQIAQPVPQRVSHCRRVQHNARA
jgi:hypothetical protein